MIHSGHALPEHFGPRLGERRGRRIAFNVPQFALTNALRTRGRSAGAGKCNVPSASTSKPALIELTA